MDQEVETRVRSLESRVDRVETKVDDMRDDIKDIKNSLANSIFWIIGLMGTALLTLGATMVSLLKG